MQSSADEKGKQHIQAVKNDFYQKFSKLVITKNSIIRVFREKIEAEKIKEIQDTMKK